MSGPAQDPSPGPGVESLALDEASTPFHCSGTGWEWLAASVEALAWEEGGVGTGNNAACPGGGSGGPAGPSSLRLRVVGPIFMS